MVDQICLKSLWMEFVNINGGEMYKDKISYTYSMEDEDNYKITFQDNRGSQMLHNFLRNKVTN